MAGIFLLDPIRRFLHERARRARIQKAASWPQAQAHINHWKLLPAGDTSQSFSQTDIIEAAFHFTLNGEYYGGYLNSVPMGRHDAERFATGSPDITIRYNSANPDETVVLAEDNSNLPFQIVSS